MKKETYANKLAELLGLDKKVVEKSGYADTKKSKSTKNSDALIGISESEIQAFRAAQGLMYFLQAPELFSHKKCPHCGEEFLVSRKYVAFCSYTCIAKNFEQKFGVKWSKDGDYEALANDPQVYEGNEPIWVRNLDRVRQVLENSEESLLSSVSTPSRE